jgi:hypothetical protein
MNGAEEVMGGEMVALVEWNGAWAHKKIMESEKMREANREDEGAYRSCELGSGRFDEVCEVKGGVEREIIW